MNKFIVLLAIASACGAEPSALPPDAAQLPADAAMPADAALPRDAAIDTPAPEPESRGCMGNLPNSRTVTVNTGDPVPPALLNELQDMIVGRKRAPWKRPVGVICMGGPFTAGAVAGSFSSTGAGDGVFLIPSDVGDRILGLDIAVAGDATHNVTYKLERATVGSGIITATAIGTVSETPSPSGIRIISVAGVTQTVLGANSWFQMRATVNGSSISVYNLIPQFDIP